MGQVEAIEPTTTGNYRASALNALKHGVLSRHMVLPHEDHAEFEALLASLHAEYEPQGPTELHLVEEIAGILWRKRRVLMAECASLNEGLNWKLSNSESLGEAMPTDARLSGARFGKRELLNLTTDKRAEYIADVREDLEHTERAAAILEQGGPNVYKRAIEALREDSRDWWLSEVENGEREATSEGLALFIEWKLRPECEGQLAAVERQQEVAAHLQGKAVAYQTSRADTLQRYETHLDRKFERTLAMLLKLRELRALG